MSYNHDKGYDDHSKLKLETPATESGRLARSAHRRSKRFQRQRAFLVKVNPPMLSAITLKQE